MEDKGSHFVTASLCSHVGPLSVMKYIHAIIIIIIIITNSYIAHFTITVSMLFTLVPWSWGQ